MEKINLDSTEYLRFRNPDFEGNEGKLYICNNQIYKFYKNFWQYDSKKLETLIALQKSINYTTLPLGCINVENIFMGTILKYFDNHKKLIELKNYNIDFIVFMLKDLKQILQELTSQNIYPTDLDDENILVSKYGKLELIDLDGLDTVLSEQKDLDLLKTVINLYKNIILDFLYPKYDKIACYGNEEEHFEKIGVPRTYIDCFIKKDLNYEILDELITQTYQDKIYRK